MEINFRGDRLKRRKHYRVGEHELCVYTVDKKILSTFFFGNPNSFSLGNNYSS